jgi:hypothetical protein
MTFVAIKLRLHWVFLNDINCCPKLAKVVKWSLVIVNSLLTFDMLVNLYLFPFLYDVTDSNFWNAQYFRNTPIRVTILEKSYYFNLIKVRNWSHSDNFDRLGNKLKIQFITSVILTRRHFF